MPFVKLDCGILNSTLWFEREAREIFITALLMAQPREYSEPVPEIAISEIRETGWSAPPGWYGFVHAASSGIVRRAGMELQAGMEALQRLASPEPSSRSPEHDGRRMIRVSGGFLILNYQKYREKDHTAAERSRRYREAKLRRHGVPSESHTVTPRSVTQAEAEAE